MHFKKLIVGITGQNDSGKSTVSRGLSSLGILHYSMREVIRIRHKRIHGIPILEEAAAFQKFAEHQKRAHGESVLIQEAVENFVKSGNDICIIDSIRSPAEGSWLLDEPPKLYPDVASIIIGIKAAYWLRLERELNRPDGLSKTISEFEEREVSVNSGQQPWEENVTEVMKLAIKIFENKGKQINIIMRVHTFLMQIMKTKEIPSPETA